jgi:hypothetical protein
MQAISRQIRYARQVERKRLRLERKFTKALRAALHEETKAISAAVRQNPLAALENLDAAVQDSSMGQVMQAMYRDVANSFKIEDPENLLKSIDSIVWETIVSDYIRVYAARAITEIRRTTKEITQKQLRPILDEGIQQGMSVPDIGKNMQAKLAEYAPDVERYRAIRIARTEIVSVSNWATIESVRGSDAQDLFLKRWLPAMQENTRESHAAMMDKPPIELDELFEVGGELLAYPGDPSGSPENVINCRCTVIFIRK